MDAWEQQLGFTVLRRSDVASGLAKQRWRGGRIEGDIVRGSVAGIREGMKYVPLGKDVMKMINPVLDEGLTQLSDWEKGIRPVDRMTQAEKDAAYVKAKRLGQLSDVMTGKRKYRGVDKQGNMIFR